MIINYALTVILLILLTGIGIDTGLMEYHQTQLAACVKAAAISMTMAIQRNFSAANIKLAGQVTAQFNGFTNNANGVTLTFETPPSGGPYAGVSGAARVVATQASHNTFMSILGSGASTLRAEFTQPGATATPASGFNRKVMYTDGATILGNSSDGNSDGGLDGSWYALSANALAPVRTANNLAPLLSWRGNLFYLGMPNVADAWANTTVSLPTGHFSQLLLLEATGYGSSSSTLTMTVNYSDSTSTAKTLNTSDWASPNATRGEDIVASMPYRLRNNWGYYGPSNQLTSATYIGGYSVNLDQTRAVSSVSISNSASSKTSVLAMDLIP